MFPFTAGTLWWCHLLPPLQGGYWGLYSPTGHPRHPRLPLPFVPRWGNRRRGCGGWRRGVIKPRLATVRCYLPRPLLSHLSAVANLPPLTRTFCRQHVTHSLHLTSPCTFKWQQSAPTLLIFDVNRHGVNWKISGWFWLFTENHQTRTPTFTVNHDLNLIINFPMPLHNAEKRYLVARCCCDTSGSSGELQTSATEVEFYLLSTPEPGLKGPSIRSASSSICEWFCACMRATHISRHVRIYMHVCAAFVHLWTLHIQNHSR